MNPLFDSKFETDDAELAVVLTSVEYVALKNFLEDLWQKYQPRIGSDEIGFRADLKAQPFPRIWEMYLAVALVESEFDVAHKPNRGPDLKLVNPTIWVEAVSSTDGNKNGKQIQPSAATPEVLLPPVSSGPPEGDIILRYLTSIDEKMKKLLGYDDRKGKWHPGYIERGIVNHSEPYVIALNTYKTSFALYDHQHTPNHLPTIAKSVFGYGNSGRVSSDRWEYEYRSHVINRSDAKVSADIFFQEAYSSLSALILSKGGFCMWQQGIQESLSENFMVIRNPLAKNRLPQIWLKSGHEIWIEGGQLHKRIWRNGNEHLVESFPLPYNMPPDIKAKLP